MYIITTFFLNSFIEFVKYKIYKKHVELNVALWQKYLFDVRKRDRLNVGQDR